MRYQLIWPHTEYRTSIPYASCLKSPDGETVNMQVCFVCFLFRTKDFLKPCSELGVWVFQLRLPHVSGTGKREPASTGQISSLVSIPENLYPKTSPPLATAMKWAKQKVEDEALKYGMTEAVHWVAKTYLRPDDAAQLGLMGPASVTDEQVPWPALNLPAMTMDDFTWTHGGGYQECVELPYPDSWYSGLGFDDGGTMAAVEDDLGAVVGEAVYGTELFI